MMVGHEQARPDQKARAVAEQVRLEIPELDAADRARGRGSLGEIVDAVEIIALDDPLKADLGLFHVLRLRQQLTLAQPHLVDGHLDRTVTQFPVQGFG
ncbi:hypothetical protein ACVOMS_08750 [Bradyrhizobium guangxiense]